MIADPVIEKEKYMKNRFGMLMIMFAIPTILSILSSVLITPALPSIKYHFDVPVDEAQLVMSLNLLDYAISLLFYGWLIDYFGRRPILIISIMVFAVASIGCAVASTFYFLLLGRLIQGIAAGSLSVIVLTSIRDLYEGNEAVKIYSIFGIITGITPIVGALTGGILIHFGWQSPFVVLSAIAVLSLIVIIINFPETIKNTSKRNYFEIIRDYGKLIFNVKFMIYALLVCYSWSSLYKLISVSPFIYDTHYKSTSLAISLLIALTISMYTLGNILSKKMSKRYDVEKIFRIGCLFTLSICFCQALLFFLNVMNEAWFTISSMLIALNVGLLFASATLRTIDSSSLSTGVTVSFLGFME